MYGGWGRMLWDAIFWMQLGYGNHKFTLAVMCKRPTQEQASQILGIDDVKDL